MIMHLRICQTGIRSAIATIFVTCVLALLLTACSGKPSYPAAPVSGADVVIDATSFSSGIPHFFSYDFERKRIDFFVIRIDNRVLSFLDACQTCSREKRGYRFEESAFVCRACNERYTVEAIETGFGSCYPIRLEGRLENSRYVIARSALEKKSHLF